MLVENVKFASEHGKGECPAVLIKGKDSNTTRGLVVLQEWWGLNQQIQDEAKEITERGDFVALVPDLYRGELATDNEHAGHLMNNLDWPGAVKDITGNLGPLWPSTHLTNIVLTYSSLNASGNSKYAVVECSFFMHQIYTRFLIVWQSIVNGHHSRP